MISAGVLFQGMGFGSWIKKMLSNILVFPAIGILFFLAFRFLIASYGAMWQTLAEGSTFELVKTIFDGITSIVPGETVDFTQFVGTYAEGYHEWPVPFMGPGTSTLALIFLSAAVMMLMPKVGKMIEGFFSGRPMDVESAIGEALGPVKTVGGAAANLASTGKVPDFIANINTKKGTVRQRVDQWKAAHPKADARIQAATQILSSFQKH